MKINTIFASDMVLQRNVPIPIWGTGEENEKISISILKYNTTVVVKNGQWMAELPPMGVTRNLEITIESCNNKIVLKNVLVGDVYLAAGQSNMEFQMRYDKDYKYEIENCEYKEIRFWDCPEISFDGQDEIFDYSKMGIWRKCNQNNLDYYSAIGYYFAKEIYDSEKIPIGIVGCNWGGTASCAWMSQEYIEKNGEIWLEDYNKNLIKMPSDYMETYKQNSINDRGNPFADAGAESVMYGIPIEEQAEMVKILFGDSDEELFIGPYDPGRPGALYQTMVKRIAPFPMKAVLWYQGESDEAHADMYASVMSDLIDCWRELWKKDLPFFCVQLAPFKEWLGLQGTNFPRIRKQQELLSLKKDGVFLISSSDVGTKYDIHPKEKKPIGHRLALSIEKNIYSHNVLCEAPKPESIKKNQNKMVITFAHAGKELYLEGETLNAIQICIKAEEWEPIDKYICSLYEDKLIFEFDEEIENKEIKILFATTPYYEVNLYNEAGIPALPFTEKI